ncbi:MAG: DAK2 domain-containing protein [Anaerobutyricum soehngenii]
MNSHTIDAKSFQKLFLAGANRINSRKDYINELNVFPVPDGDTGTNMSLTILAAAKVGAELSEPTMATICKALKQSGSLRGARGNSSVPILSQLFRGFTRQFSKADSLGKDEITARIYKSSRDAAYKAVMKPKEGTILTVAKGMADKAEELVDEDMDVIAFCEAIVAYGYEVLSKTPDMLPVLKEAGVVDSGGQGLMEVLQGIVDALTGKVTEIEVPAEAASMSSAVISAPKADISTADIKFGYCTEFIILLDKPLTKEEEKGLKKFFLSIGDSLVLVADEEICKVHVHTNHPGQAFEKALTFGALSNMKIDNMRLEHQEKLIKDAENEAARQRQQEAEEEKLTAQEAAKAQPAKEVGFIAVSAGEGLTDIFKGLGVDYLIEGGQTMNPSTEDMLNAIDQVNAKNIFILPNNKNIILAAEQARDLTEDKKIVVLPTKTIPQGISAMIGYMPEASVDENAENMKDACQDIASGQVTYAVRDTSIDGKEIHNGDIMGINDDGIAAVGKDLMETTIDLLSTMVDEDSELICLYYGADVSKQDADALSDEIEEKFPECEVEVNFGGQPIYYYMISVE